MRLLFHLLCFPPPDVWGKAPVVLQSRFWKGQCYICNGVLSDAVVLARRVRPFCPFGGEKQQRQEARGNLLSRARNTLLCSAVVEESWLAGFPCLIPCSSQKGYVPERACPPFTWAWCMTLPMGSRLLGTPLPALARLEGDRGRSRMPLSVAGPRERWAEPQHSPVSIPSTCLPRTVLLSSAKPWAFQGEKAECSLTRDFCFIAIMSFYCLLEEAGWRWEGEHPTTLFPGCPQGRSQCQWLHFQSPVSLCLCVCVCAFLWVVVSPLLCLLLAAGAEREGGVIGCWLHRSAPSAGTHTYTRSHTHIGARTPQKLSRAAPAPVKAGNEHPAARRATPPPLAKKQPAQQGE